MIEPLTIWEMLLRAGLAALLGLAIGWDREKKEKAAGLRTMALVSLGAAGVMLCAHEIATQFAAQEVSLDPLRVISGVVGGIGFLGAGAIIQSRGEIRGLTTAASIWAAAGIGIACGAGLFRLAFILCGVVLSILVVVTALKGRVLPERQEPDEPPTDA